MAVLDLRRKIMIESGLVWLCRKGYLNWGNHRVEVVRMYYATHEGKPRKCSHIQVSRYPFVFRKDIN